MNVKFTIKSIKAGQTQKVNVVAGGAGISGNALILNAVDGMRFQLADIVTLVSPKKLQTKRHGADLHLALPGGDLEAPDVVIKNYFVAKNASLWGTSVEGEALAYNTDSLASSYVATQPLTEPSSTTGASLENLAASEANVSTTVATLGGSSAGMLSSPWLWVAGVGLGAAAAGGGGGGGGGSSATPTDPQSIITNYSGGANGATPTQKDYEALGVVLPTITGTSDVLNAMNALVASKTASEVNTADKLNALASSLHDAYARILSEANGAAPDATPDDNPSVSDYANMGVTVSSQTKTLDLLNSALGELSTNQVATIAKLKTLADTAHSVMKLAAVATGGATPALAQTDTELIAGLNALLGSTAVTSSNIAAIKTSLISAADDGTGLATVAQLKSVVSLQSLKDYANATNGIGVTAPSLSTYKDAGIKALNNLSEVTASADIDSATVAANMGSTWQQALNSALDKQVGDSTLTANRLQALVNSYYRILSEADGTTTNVDVYPGASDATGDASLAGNNDPSKTDYTNIGVTIGNDKSVDLLNDYVGSTSKTSVDTVNEINVIAKAAYNVMRLAGVAPSTAAPATYSASDNNAEWIAGLNTLLGLDINSSNIEAIKKAIEDTQSLGTAGDGLEVDTIQEIKDIIKPAIALQVLKNYAMATNGSGGVTVPTLSTYTDLGLKTFKSLSDTSEANRKALNDPSTANGDSNTLLTATVLNTALDRQNAATFDKVTAQKMIDAYYRILKEADGDANVDKDVYADTTNDATNANAWNDPTLADYNALGVTVSDAITTTTGNETLDLLNDAVGRLNTTSVDTVDKLQTLATTANDIMLLAKGAAITQSESNFIAGMNALLGLTSATGVNTENISAFKAAIANTADTGLGVDTVSELLSQLALVRLQTFKSDSGVFTNNSNTTKTASPPTLSDWSLLGTGLEANSSLSDNTRVALNKANYWQTTNASNGLQALNSALDAFDKANPVTQTALQNIVDSYGRVLQAADGSRSTVTDVSKVSNLAALTSQADVIEQDLIHLGVTASGTNDGSGTGLYYKKTGELLASSIGSMASTAVDSVSELNTLCGYAEGLMKHAAGTANGYSDSQWLDAFTNLRIGGVNATNLADVRTAIANTADDGSGIDTWDELQAVASLVRLNNYATGADTASTIYVSDYQAIAYVAGKTDAYTTVKVGDYLNAYNSVIWAKTAINSDGNSTNDIAEVGNMIKAYTKLIDMADGVDNVVNTTNLSSGGTDEYSTDTGTDGTHLNNTNNLTADDFNAIFQGAVTYRITDLTNSIASSGTVKAKTIADTFSDIVDQLPRSSVDSVTELAEIGGVLNKLFLMASDGSATPTVAIASQQQGLTKAELGLLGLKVDGNTASGSNITDAEFKGFCDSIILATPTNGSNINSFAELQTLLNQAVANF